MATASTDERVLLAQAVERFVRDSCSLEQRRALLQQDRSFSRENWATLAEMGVLALPFQERDGGLDGSLFDVMAVTRELGRGLALEPYLPCVIVAGRLLAAATNEALRAEWLPGVIAGERLLGLAHVEHQDHSRAVVRGTKLRIEPPGYRLEGAKILVPVARDLDAFLVTARDDAGRLQVCLVPAGSAGVSVRSYRTVDGQLTGEVSFAAVAVEHPAVLQATDMEATLERVLGYARAALCADMLGCMQALLQMTIEYCGTRKQFGQPIGSFQVLKHRLVDCHTSVAQAEAILELAGHETRPSWAADVAAAMAFIDEHAVRVGHEAIQMHGAMGLTDELAVSHYHKRIVASSIAYGDRNSQTDEFVVRAQIGDPAARTRGLPFTELLSPGEEFFRQQVRAFLAEALSDELRQANRRLTCTFPEKDTVIAWQQRLSARGWLAPLWPVELGGTGWTAVERFLFEYECALAGAPERVPMGFRYVGPIVARFGSEWQKSYFLPRLLASEHYWAQGFSEPGAGSDLAALKTTAVRKGDRYLVNGSKMWTTNAHSANWIFCLVRTGQGTKPQDGISFLLIDLKSPGVRVEPIRLLAVDHEVNQVFFEDVAVPVENLVGEPGRGWQYAKYLLELERGGSVFCGRTRFELNAVKTIVATKTPAQWRDTAGMRSLAALELRLMALEMLELRVARSMQHASDPGVAGSMTKLLSSELQKDITEMGVQAAGFAGLELEPRRPMPDPGESGFCGLDLELVAMPRYLNTRVTSIFGGSSEIQHEIIAKHILGFK
jgi:alkylation response protein AidB-like acyl-CoA dehydrogenase